MIVGLVLVIISLLAAGTLKGQQMIENAKYKSFVKEVDAVRVAMNQFKNRYRYLPGDFPYATSKLPQIDNITLNNGNGDGKIQHGWATESSWALQHLIVSGLLSGDPNTGGNGSKGLVPAIGGTYSSISTEFWTNSSKPAIYFRNVPIRFMKRYDEEFDDGKANSGTIYCAHIGSDVITQESLCIGTTWNSEDKTTAAIVTL